MISLQLTAVILPHDFEERIKFALNDPQVVDMIISIVREEPHKFQQGPYALLESMFNEVKESHQRELDYERRKFERLEMSCENDRSNNRRRVEQTELTKSWGGIAILGVSIISYNSIV